MKTGVGRLAVLSLPRSGSAQDGDSESDLDARTHSGTLFSSAYSRAQEGVSGAEHVTP